MLMTYLDNLFNRNRLSLNFLAQLDDIFFFCELYLFKARNILLLCFCFWLRAANLNFNFFFYLLFRTTFFLINILLLKLLF